MDSKMDQIARAFSSHQFADTYPYLSGEVRWDVVGGELITGRDAVIERCNASAAYRANVFTTFQRFKVVVGAESVVVDTLATYADSDKETTVVASCDLYDFVDGTVVEIRSYTVEVNGQA
jgi:hypothetical protein